MIKPHFPYLGFGLGLRTEHYLPILEQHPNIDWFEILTENYLVPGGKPLYYLNQIKERYPIVMHGVSMSLGSTDPLDFDYLKKVKTLSKQVNAQWISDHLCWTGVQKKNMHDLLPLPLTYETLTHLVKRISIVQDFLEQPILIENASTYLTFVEDEMTEWAFLNALTQQANCYLLLDINNIYVSAFNHGFDPLAYLQGISKDRVQQFHLAGHTNNGNHIIDTHDAPIVDPVWQLYSHAVQIIGKVSTMIERDDHIPPLEILMQELNIAKELAHKTRLEDSIKETEIGGIHDHA